MDDELYSDNSNEQSGVQSLEITINPEQFQHLMKAHRDPSQELFDQANVYVMYKDLVDLKADPDILKEEYDVMMALFFFFLSAYGILNAVH